VRAVARLLILGGRAGGHVEIGGVAAFRAGFVDEMHAAVAGLDLVWHPAPAEGLGTALLDAMALRVPPVAFAVGGIPELIEDGRTGVLVPPGDAAAFASVASSLIASPSARAALGAGGPTRAREFSVERMVDGTETVYRRALAAVGR
jgi:glycosyltransferase involved in cell wall biosynthesis